MGKQWKQCQTLFLGAPKSLQMLTAAMTLKKCIFLGRKATINLDSILKSTDVTLTTKIHLVKAMAFPVVMYGELDHKDGWALKNWCFWIVMLEKTLESPLDCKQIKPVNPKGNQPWIGIERTDINAEAPILWPPDAKSQLSGKDPDAGKDWGQEEKTVTEDKMVGWPTHWPRIWASSQRWWRTGKPGMLQSTGSQRVRLD